MSDVRKTIRFSKNQWQDIEKKLSKSKKNFGEFARESFKKSSIKEYRPAYETGLSDFQLIGSSIGATLVVVLILINTLIPIRYVSFSDWIVPTQNRYISEDNKFIIFSNDDVMKIKEKPNKRFLGINNY